MTDKTIDELVREQRGESPPRFVRVSDATLDDLDQSLRSDAVVLVPDDFKTDTNERKDD
jgi:hypothetical protein